MSNQNEDISEAISHARERYAADGFGFLGVTLNMALKERKRGKRKTVNAQELLDSFRRQALAEFGPMSHIVLDHWGIRKCQDIGFMVYCLVKEEVFGQNEGDSVEDFYEVYDFHDVFVKPYLP